jgi:hypothetical protein
MKLLLPILLAVILVASGCVGQQAPQPQPSPVPVPPPADSYSLKAGVVLASPVEGVVSEIADCYAEATQKPLVITSGTRTAAEQASAMFDKLEQGDRLTIYSNQVAAGEIRDAYDAGKAAGASDASIKAGMAAAIEAQISNSIYISKHLKSGAVDISQQGMTDDDKFEFELCAETTDGVSKVIDEETPVHYHLEISASPSAQPQPPAPLPSPPSPIPSSAVKIDSASCVATGVDSYGDRHYKLQTSGTASGPPEAEFQLTLNPGYYPDASCTSWGPSELQTCKRGSGPESTSWSGSTDEIVEGATLRIAGYQIDVQARIIMFNGVAAEEVRTVTCQ